MTPLISGNQLFPVIDHFFKITFSSTLYVSFPKCEVRCVIIDDLTMKTKYKIAAILLLILATTHAFGQIPNSGFESWTNMGNYINPEGWWTTNDSIESGSFYPATRSTDHYPASVGNYSIRLENNIALLPGWGAFGLTWTGDFKGSNFPVFPLNGHPTSLYGYYKFAPQNNDTMEIHIRIYKNGVDISGGSYKTAAAATEWTAFSMTFNEYADADSARIFMSTCYDNDAPVPHGNSVLYIDNISFDSLIIAGIPEVDVKNTVSVYPNPASDLLTIHFSVHIAKQIDLSIMNACGQTIYSQKITANMSISPHDISQFPAGIYFVRVAIEKQNIYNQKIIIVR
jgi:hypothetical protein